MSYQQVLNYDSASGFSFNASLVEFLMGKAQLKLQPKPGLVFSQTFDNDTGFTYDSDLSFFSAGSVIQKDQVPAGSIAGGKFDSKDLNWRTDGGSLAGTLNGAPTLSGGKMTCVGSQGVSYSKTSAAQETWIIEYTPTYTGVPIQNLNMVSSSGSTSDKCQLTHSPSGDNFRLTLHDSSGVQLYLAQTIGANGVNLQAGTIYRFALQLDSTGGTARLYMKTGAGAWALHGTLSPGAWSRGAVAKSYFVGADTVTYNYADATFDEYWIFNSLVTPTVSDPGVVPFRRYLENKVDIPSFNYTGLGVIQAVEGSTIIEAGLPRYIVGLQYWNGSIWTASNGTYAQANDGATAIANLPSINVTGSTVVPVSVVFPDSNSQSSVDSISVTITGQEYPDYASVKSTSQFETDDFISFTEDKTGTVKYTLFIDGVQKWLSAGALVASDGTPAQANTAAELLAGLPGILTVGVKVLLNVLLISPTRTEQATITQNVIEYSKYGGTPVEPDLVHVYEHFRNILGSYVSGVKLKVAIPRAYNAGGVVALPIQIASVDADAEGYAEIELVKSTVDSRVPYVFTVEWTDLDGTARSAKFKETYVTADGRLSSITELE